MTDNIICDPWYHKENIEWDLACVQNPNVWTNFDSYQYKTKSNEIKEKLPNLPKITKNSVEINAFKTMWNWFISNWKIITSKHILTYKSDFSWEIWYIQAGDGSIKINGKEYPIENIEHINWKDISIITLKWNHIDTNSIISNNFEWNSFTIHSRFGKRDLWKVIGTSNRYLQNSWEGYLLYEFKQWTNQAIEWDSGSKVVNNTTWEVVWIVCAVDPNESWWWKVYIQPL